MSITIAGSIRSCTAFRQNNSWSMRNKTILLLLSVYNKIEFNRTVSRSKTGQDK